MIPPTIAKRMINPQFNEQDFTPTKYHSSSDKAKFANKLLKFIADDFPRQSFTGPFYRQLSNTFGHIAHYNIEGFYSEFFTSTYDKIQFLQRTESMPCYGDPAYTYCDVERAIQRRLRSNNITSFYQRKQANETETAERSALARLKAKYEHTSENIATIDIEKTISNTTSYRPMIQTDLFD